jgi:predicted metal-dependent hydrolase
MLRLFRIDTPRKRETLHLDVCHGGDNYKVALKRVAGARRFTLRVRSATRDVVLTMPVRGSLSSAREFVERHAAWIGARLNRLPRPVPFETGAVIPLRGVNHVIHHRPDLRGNIWIEAGVAVSLEAENALCVACEAPHLSRRVLDYFRKEARRDLEASVKRHTLAIGVAARRVTVRDTVSRWGSCSASGALNFSWRLILAPPFVLDYLAAHEVAHLIHLNHSPLFWALTNKLAPETDRAEAWLKAHGASLHRFGSVDPGA